MNSMITDEEFHGYVGQAVDSLPPAYAERLENVTFIVQELAGREICLRMNIPTPYALFGLYEGVPQPKRGSYQMVLPDRITLYKIPHLLASEDLTDLKKRIRATILHEVGHHFGLSEEELSGME
jgi:predicted Zn-dependent protease with MMP-like domain